MAIKRELGIRVVTDDNSSRSGILIRSSVIYDIRGANVIIAQTDPPIARSMFQKEVMVTYLRDGEKGPLRVGFPGKVTEFWDEYELSSSEKVKAVTITRKGEPSPYNIRMSYRVEPTSKSNISMTVDDHRVNIIDLSLGGVRFSYDKELALVHYEAVRIVLTIDGKPLSLDARILRTWGGDGVRSGLMFASAEFPTMSIAAEHELSKKMREIEREGQRV